MRCWIPLANRSRSLQPIPSSLSPAMVLFHPKADTRQDRRCPASDPMKLRAEGATNFASDAPTAAVPSPAIVQGAIEESNVQPVLEVTRMMDNERQFQFVTQLVQAEGDRQQNAIDKLLPTGSGA